MTRARLRSASGLATAMTGTLTLTLSLTLYLNLTLCERLGYRDEWQVMTTVREALPLL